MIESTIIEYDHWIWVDVPYLQVSFQLYIKARDSDLLTSDDDLDDIFIGHTLQLEANTGFTKMKGFTGILNRVNFQARFRVTCQHDYYGAHCNTHCVPQNDDRTGHYECNSDGSIRCLEGFENPNKQCKDSKLIMQTMEISYCSRPDNVTQQYSLFLILTSIARHL